MCGPGNCGAIQLYVAHPRDIGEFLTQPFSAPPHARLGSAESEMGG